MKTNIIQSITGGLVVVVAFIFAGMLAFNDGLPYLNGWKRITTIVVLVLYASYRFSRIYKDLKTNKQQNESI
jgi:type IV secretory pathway VirB2 component (pilin)